MSETPHPDSNMTADETRLRAMLQEDLDSPDEVEALLPVIRQMRRWSSPEVNQQEITGLLASLILELPQPKSRLKRGIQRLTTSWSLLLLFSQIRVVRREIWFASSLILALGTVVTLATYIPASESALPIAIIAPFVAACGVALLYDTEVERMLEIEDSTPASARILLLARLTLVFGFDLSLSLAASILLSLLQSQISLWPLVISWLAPMAFLSALAFLLSVLLVDAVAGALFSLMLWAMNVLLRSVSDLNDLTRILSLPGLTNPETRPFLLVGAIPLVAVALWLAGKNERNIGEAV